MAKRRRAKPPGYLPHKTGQALVRIGGVNHYLGLYGTPESHERYWAKLAGRQVQGDQPAPSSIPMGRVA
jgi:hypothetical protein